MRRLLPACLVLAAACGSSSSKSSDAGAVADAAPGADAADAADPADAGDAPDAGNCQPPDVLVVLDRTMSMHRRPDATVPPNTPDGHKESKWYLAVAAVEALTAQDDRTIRFGLELFPRDPGGAACVTLSERIAGTTATNPQCEAGEVVVPPDLATSGAIAAAIDPETTHLCTSTPIGAALGTAKEALAAIHDPVRDQFVMLVSDGQDSCDGPLVISTAQALAAAGVKTFAVAFDGSGGGVDNGALNDLACAGHTAPGFPAPCTADASGGYVATDRNGPPLYLRSTDAAGLTAAFQAIAGAVCCGCLSRGA